MRSFLCICLLAFVPAAICASSVMAEQPSTDDFKGWSYLSQLLVKNGLKESVVTKAFSDVRMPKRDFLVFNLSPKESKAQYRLFNTARHRANALKFYQANSETFAAAKKKFGVPEEVVLAILQVETQCGKNTGGRPVFPAIARLANARDPENMERNFKEAKPEQRDLVIARATYLEETFLPHLMATFKIAPEEDVHLLRGSYAGAIGLPQFMPGNVLELGADGDNDGKVDLFAPADAIFSTANYLKEKGWKSDKLEYRQKWSVIWEYNHSKPYVETVLTMADALGKILRRGVTEQDLTVKFKTAKYEKPARKSARSAKAVRKRAGKSR